MPLNEKMDPVVNPQAQRHYAPLLTEAFIECPIHTMELVHMDDRATFVFTDFTHNRPAIISSDLSIDAALDKMKRSREHLLLVIDDVNTDSDTGRQSAAVIGQITACDIHGEVPVRIARETGIQHDDITVKMVMTPRRDIQVVDWVYIISAKVGHILATMHARECCHILVVEEGTLRGIFSMSEISRHLDHVDTEPEFCAHSLAELVHRVG